MNKPAVSYTFEMKREFEKVGGGTSPQPEGTQAPLKVNFCLFNKQLTLYEIE